MASKSKKKDKQPSVPNYQNIDTSSLKQPSQAEAPKYEPMSINDFNNWMDASYKKQLEYAPSLVEAQRQAQSSLFNNMAGLQQAQAPAYAATANQLLEGYNPEFRQQYNLQGYRLNELDADVGRQGDVARQGLSDGYNLGEGLTKEMEQSIRGAQMARGNWLGPAPTAQEAFGKGQASIDLYNQRYNQYGQYLGSKEAAAGARQNYLQGRNPMDMMGQAAGNFMGQSYYPNQAYVDTSLGANAMASSGSQGQQYNSTVMSGYGTYQNALQNYNQNTISATNANNEAMYGQYDRTADAWQYREAARQGLYSTPNVSSGGMGGVGSMIGGVAGGVGTAVSGLAAAGVIGGGAAAAGGVAAAGGAAAAASAAASALCWLARKLIPNWKSYRKWLFTKATQEERQDYLYNARRLANSIP